MQLPNGLQRWELNALPPLSSPRHCGIAVKPTLLRLIDFNHLSRNFNERCKAFSCPDCL